MDLVGELGLMATAAALAHGHAPAAGGAGAAAARLGEDPWFAALMPLLPLLGCVLCGLMAALRVRSKLPAWVTVGLLGGAFVAAVATHLRLGGAGPGGVLSTTLYEWIGVRWGPGRGQELIANFGFYLDSLAMLWMLFVTGLATLIALYASEYMAGDAGVGYCRFFAAFNLFVFSMACLVMADNLVLLYLGWEGVGLCSYLLIGYFYQRPPAVAAAKKAFIMNRIGDLGLALALMLTFVHFGSVEFGAFFARLDDMTSGRTPMPATVPLIPLLLTLGAFGKSAQVPLYVWLPDAMEGPTPVSALIHAATMVTAGVYLVARFLPLYGVSELALGIVAWGGAITALLAATIAMAQFDIKRIMAYSTVSQLGFMFAGLGVVGAVGAGAHVFTHAFFKALLFLACGAVMHGFAGQLDLRRLSGIQKLPGWRLVGITMLVGCLNLAGFPFVTAGFWSKDMILADALGHPRLAPVGWVLLLTAALTAYYTFRVYFRVFVGPVHVEPGDEAGHGHADHGHGVEQGHVPEGHAHGEAAAPAHGTSGEFHPHAPGWAINLVLAALAVGAFAVIPLVALGGHGGWVGRMVHGSTAGAAHAAAHHEVLGLDPHLAAMLLSGLVAVLGIVAAWWLHYAGRTSAAHSRADALAAALGPVALAARRKWLVDELYRFLFVTPLRVIAHVFHLIDLFIVDGLVSLAGVAPRGAGRVARRGQSGVLHDYALRMAGGLALILLIVVMGATR